MSAGVKVTVTTVPMADLLGGLKTFFNTVMLAAHADVAKPGRVPIDTGYLRGSLSPGGGVTMVDPSDPPMWAVVGSNVPYGGVLEESDHHHYLDGPSAGQLTQGWLSKTVPNIDGEVQRALAELAESIGKAHKDAQ